MSQEKSQAELLKEVLFFEKKHFSNQMSEEELKKADDFCEGYKEFLSVAKTERECVDYMIEAAEAKGFVPFDNKKTYKAGDKVYLNNRGKSIILAVIGEKGVSEGAKIVAAHIDSPRLNITTWSVIAQERPIPAVS